MILFLGETGGVLYKIDRPTLRLLACKRCKADGQSYLVHNRAGTGGFVFRGAVACPVPPSNGPRCGDSVRLILWVGAGEKVQDLHLQTTHILVSSRYSHLQQPQHVRSCFVSLTLQKNMLQAFSQTLYNSAYAVSVVCGVVQGRDAVPLEHHQAQLRIHR